MVTTFQTLLEATQSKDCRANRLSLMVEDRKSEFQTVHVYLRGLISPMDERVEITLFRREDMEWVRFYTSFEDEYNLPTNARDVYNLFKCLDSMVTFDILPSIDSNAVTVCGTRVEVPLQTLSGTVFNKIISSLRCSTELAEKRLRQNEGDDWWHLDGGQ